MSTLFSKPNKSLPDAPLAERLRPATLAEVIGQSQILGEDAPLTHYLSQERLPSLILWGPPGCGKTTIARLLATHNKYAFQEVSAIFTGVADLKKLFEHAKQRHATGERTLLFVDEIHRFNKSQQDAFLPHLEAGTITLIGATTENPSFELNAALLSRAHVLVLTPLTEADLDKLLCRLEEHMGTPLPLHEDGRQALIEMAQGDGRALINMAEHLANQQTPLDRQGLIKHLQRRFPSYDKKGDQHYNLISALHKSLRGSDPDAALYWFYRMLEGGEDPLYVGRRLIRFASEDVGLADPNALAQALHAVEAYQVLGSPEGDLNLVQALIYLATAPKSNALYDASKKAQQAARKFSHLSPPKHILNAPTPLMSDLGYGEGYQYDHDTPEGFSGQSYLPEAMPPLTFYAPPERGFERDINKRLTYWRRLKERLTGDINNT